MTLSAVQCYIFMTVYVWYGMEEWLTVGNIIIFCCKYIECVTQTKEVLLGQYATLAYGNLWHLCVEHFVWCQVHLTGTHFTWIYIIGIQWRCREEKWCSTAITWAVPLSNIISNVAWWSQKNHNILKHVKKEQNVKKTDKREKAVCMVVNNFRLYVKLTLFCVVKLSSFYYIIFITYL